MSMYPLSRFTPLFLLVTIVGEKERGGKTKCYSSSQNKNRGEIFQWWHLFWAQFPKMGNFQLTFYCISRTGSEKKFPQWYTDSK